MNKKEIAEIRRRFAPDRNAIDRVFGCYVNEKKEVVSTFSKPLMSFPQDEAERYLSIFKKTLSGHPGRNLFDIAFRPDQVGGEPHSLLMQARDSALSEGADALCRRIIDSLEMEGSCLILMAHDAYDVPRRHTDEHRSDVVFDEVFHYIAVAVCPVKLTRPILSYFPSEEAFHTIEPDLAVGMPEVGFMFPAFDDRAANLCAAQFYTRDAANLRAEFIDGVFGAEAPLSLAEQRQAFCECLSDGLDGEVPFDVAQTLHDNVTGQLLDQKKDDAPLEISRREIAGLLQDCGVAPERIAAFEARYTARFGEGVGLPAAGVIEPGHFEVKTDCATVTVDTDRSDLVTARRIDGIRYILVQVEGDVTVNGAEVVIP